MVHVWLCAGAHRRPVRLGGSHFNRVAGVTVGSPDESRLSVRSPVVDWVFLSKLVNRIRWTSVDSHRVVYTRPAVGLQPVESCQWWD